MLKRIALALLGVAFPALGQDVGSLAPQPLPPLADPGAPGVPAKAVFGRDLTPTDTTARSIGFYSRGCLAGAQALPIDGPSWQVMRVSRNRMWGHPAMIAFLERFASAAKAQGAWNGLLVGDISQPRGGPMLTGHASHQIGLDADLWFTPMPDRRLSPAERETMLAENMVRDDGQTVDPKYWGPSQADLIRAAAEQAEVERIFVNAAIKKAMCASFRGEPWMSKVRPYWGHNYHFHVRLRCPEGQDACQMQDPAPTGDGCDKSLDWWFTDEVLHPKAEPGAKPKPPLTLAQMPAECRTIALQK
jgi:penicillin-insensitive murein DD-endopeptidase